MYNLLFRPQILLSCLVKSTVPRFYEGSAVDLVVISRVVVISDDWHAYKLGILYTKLS